MCYRNVTPSPAEKWGRRGTEFFPPQFWGWGWGRGHFLASLTWGKWDLFPPTFLCCCCRAVAREQQESLAVAALHRAGSTAQCVLAPGMAQPSIFISSHHLQHGRSSLGELKQASPLHTFKPGPHYPVHFATRIWQQTDIKSPPGGLRWLLHCLTKSSFWFWTQLYSFSEGIDTAFQKLNGYFFPRHDAGHLNLLPWGGTVALQSCRQSPGLM